MSSNNKTASEDQNTGKQAPPGDDTGSKTANSQSVPSSGGHEVTGTEKFVASGGAGGVPVQTGQGYEALAHH